MTEVMATRTLQTSEGFARPALAIVVLGYGQTFWLRAHAPGHIPAGIACHLLKTGHRAHHHRWLAAL